MSYNSKLLQTGRKVASARRKYYGSFDYGSGIDAKLRGGTFSFSKKHAWGGPDGKTWIPEIDEMEVDEPDVQALIAKYFRKHPNDAWKFGKDPETGLDYGEGFEGMSSGGTDWGGLATLGLSIAGDGVQSYNSMKAKNDALSHKYDVFGTNEFTGLTDNNALLSTMANTPLLSGANAKDFRDKSIGQDALSVIGAGVSGAKYGGIYGALAGMALKGLQIGGERWNAKILADNATMEAKRKNRQFLKDMSVASQNVDARNDWMRMLGYYNDPYLAAFGGPLHSNGGDYNGGLTYINEGGRHEENPYEGVPSGFDAEGNPNLVEEGEVIWNNEYVFSDRLKVPKELADKYKLGGKKDYTFAEAIEKLTRENKISPNDFITIATTKEIVNEFMDAQEAIREEEQLVAREELEAAQAQDFLAQLNAAQEMAPSMNAPVDLGQMSALPNEAPVTEGEMMPPGYAFGGPKKKLKEQMKKVLKDSGVMTKKEKARQKLLKLQNDIEGLFTPPSPEQVVSIPQHLDSLFRGEQPESDFLFPIFNEKTKALGGNKFEGGGWEDFFKMLEEYRGSLGASSLTGRYAIDRNAKYWNNKSAVDIQKEADYQAFTKWVKEHKDDSNVQRYFEYLDKGINKSRGAKTLLKYDKDGKITGLADDWEKTFEHRRTDDALGIYHLNPIDIAFLSAPKPSSNQPSFAAQSPFDKAIVDLIANGTLKVPEIPKKESASKETTTGTKPADTPSSSFKYRDTSLRYAPPIGAAMDWLYRRLNRPDYSNADRIIEAAYRMGAPINIPVETIGDYRRRNPYDERYLVNMANQNRAAAARGIANTAGGNRSMDLLGNMSLAHSNQQELGEIMRQAYLANRQDDAQVAEFNRGTNLYNMNAINQRNISQAQLNTHRQQAGLSGLTQGYGLRQTIHDNWDDAAVESYNSLLASLGAIGKENEEYNVLTSMAEHGYFPYYYGDRSIMQYTPQKTAKGGKLNRKKRRF